MSFGASQGEGRGKNAKGGRGYLKHWIPKVRNCAFKWTNVITHNFRSLAEVAKLSSFICQIFIKCTESDSQVFTDNHLTIKLDFI